MSAPLADVDPDIAALLDKELGRQRDTLEMIASENFAPRSVLQLQGSVLTTSTPRDCRVAGTTADASTSTPSRTSPATVPRPCSTPNSLMCNRIPAPRPTLPC
jgi:Serine hydroxymethyltransferase